MPQPDDWVDVEEFDDWQDVSSAPPPTQRAATSLPPEPTGWFDSFSSYIPQSVKDVANWATSPLTEIPSEFARSISPYIQDPMSASESVWGERIKGFGAGALEGLGDVISGFTTPLNLATMGTTGAAVRGIPATRTAAKALSGATAAQGGYHLSQAQTPAEVGLGVAEVAGGLAGTRIPKSPYSTPREIRNITGRLNREAPLPVKPPVSDFVDLPIQQKAAPIEPEVMPSSTNVIELGPRKSQYQQQANETGNIYGGVYPERGVPVTHNPQYGGYQHHVRGGENYVTHPMLDEPVGPFASADEAFDWTLQHQETPEFQRYLEESREAKLEFVDPNTGEVVPASQARPGMVPLTPEGAPTGPRHYGELPKEEKARFLEQTFGIPPEVSMSYKMVEQPSSVIPGVRRVPSQRKLPTPAAKAPTGFEGGKVAAPQADDFASWLKSFVAEEEGGLDIEALRKSKPVVSAQTHIAEYVLTPIRRVRSRIQKLIEEDFSNLPDDEWRTKFAQVRGEQLSDELRSQADWAAKQTGAHPGQKEAGEQTAAWFRQIADELDAIPATPEKLNVLSTLRRFFAEEEGGLNIDRLKELFEKSKKAALTPEELAEAKQLALKNEATRKARDISRELKTTTGRKTYVDESQLDPEIPVTRRPPPESREEWMPYQIANIPRSLQSIDFPGITSAALRQSRPLSFTPDWFRAWNKALTSFRSKEALDAINSGIKQSKYFKPRYEPIYDKVGDIIRYAEKPSIAEELGVRMTDVINTREEVIVSSLTEKIPGYGRYVKASNRAYTGFLNDLRKNKFEQMMDGAIASGRDPTTDIVLGKKIARFVNNATGRGGLGVFEKIAPEIGLALYSPRALSARMQFINPYNYTFQDPFVRKEYWKGMARIGASWGAFSGLASLMPGVHVSMDPNNADFGKVRIGNWRGDPGAGFQQMLVLAHRELPQISRGVARSVGIPGKYARYLGGGGTVSSTGPPGKPGEFTEFGSSSMAETRLSLPGRYIYNQLSPSARFIFDMLDATRKEPFDLTDRTIQMALPMYATDIFEAAKDDNVTAEFFSPLLSSMGFGTQEYKKGSFNKPVVTPVIEKYAKKLTGERMKVPTLQIGR